MEQSLAFTGQIFCSFGGTSEIYLTEVGSAPKCGRPKISDAIKLNALHYVKTLTMENSLRINVNYLFIEKYLNKIKLSP